MRVLHIGKYFPPIPGGIERFLDELTRAQTNAGLQPAVLAHHPGASASALSDDTVHRVRSWGELVYTPLSPGWPLAMNKALRCHSPQLLHLHLPNPYTFLLMASPAARRLPWLIHWHADIPRHTRHWGLRLAYPLYAVPEAALLARSKAIVATSSAYLESSEPLQRFRDRSRVVALGMGDGPPAGPPLPWPAPGLRLLSVGRLSYYKGFHVLLEALAMTPGVSWLLIGAGEQQRALEERIRILQLGDRVRLLGQTDDSTIEAAYQGCDAFCLPSTDRAEAFGMVLLESMRAGKCAIATRVAGSGMSTVVQDGCTGFVVNPEDPAALATALSSLRDDRRRCEAMGLRARERFEQNYRIEKVCDQITSIYHELVP